MLYKSLVKPTLFRIEAERAHDTIQKFARITSKSTFLKSVVKGLYNFQSPKLTQQIWGLDFKNPIGLAAGFDKNGEIPETIEALGFGFVEVGSITGKPSIGNPKPRAFRLPADGALINRMGLNNDGAQTIIKRLKNKHISIPLGVNIAKTHDPALLGDAAIRDYLLSFKQAQKVADYITVNISCPNTTEGKTFEDPASLSELLSALKIKDDARQIPTAVKFSSDLSKTQLMELLDICEQHCVNGYVACNTSSQRTGLKTDKNAIEAIGNGGLSGKPIASKSIQIIKWISEATKGQKPIIGVGGIHSIEVALEMLHAGADLLQVYTGLIYEGPGLVKALNRQLVNELNSQQIDSIHQIAALR